MVWDSSYAWLSRAGQNRERLALEKSHRHGSGEPCYLVAAGGRMRG